MVWDGTLSAVKLRPLVFWPPFLLLLVSAVLSVGLGDSFVAFASQANRWVLQTLGWLMAYASLAALVTCVLIALSPLGRLRIGGADAAPLLSRWRWFAVTLCTTVAVGILFWGAAEPTFHLHSPPPSAGAEPGTPQAATTALSVLFLHWTFTPYAIYAVPSLAFALAHYNRGRPFSLGAALSHALGDALSGRAGQLVDAVCLFALVAGMSASLGSGILTLAGGLDHLFGVSNGAPLQAAVALAIVLTFVTSAASGLQRGIRVLSQVNLNLFFALAAFVLIAGPTGDILSLGAGAVVDYGRTFLTRSLTTEGEWTRDWTLFYWANWLAWAPISAVFLGRIARGYTVREFLFFNLVAPSLFGGLWMTIFGGATMLVDLGGGSVWAGIQADGPESAIYTVVDTLPGASVVLVFFVVSVFLSYVTAADSNTSAMAGLSSAQSFSEEGAPVRLKLAWGGLIGVVATVMVAASGIDGIRTLSTLGGVPALGVVLVALVGLWRLLLAPERGAHPSERGQVTSQP